MVFFTCSHCGDSLKKNKVEKHYHTICRGKPVAVTCVDCCKDFDEQSVTAHTKCVTEEERYAAKGFTPKPSSNKGERKQQKWQDVITTVKNTRTDLGQSEIQILALLVNQENVPRKRNKFQNYLKTNLHGRYKEEIANRVFDILEEQSKLETTDESQENVTTEEKENMSLCENEEDNQQAFDMEKLSKKERKELKKKAKYEAQLKEIENENQEAIEEKPVEEDDVPKKSKKSKKSKEVATEEPEMQNGTEGEKSKKSKKSKEVTTEEPEMQNGTEGEKSKKKHKSKAVENRDLEEQQHKSKKKRKKESAEEEEEEPAEKKPKDIECQEEEQEATPKQKFNWEKVIVSLLEAKDDKELSLKRLKKKILAELECCGETNTEKNLIKFNKKIYKIPGIVILKDKVRLKLN